MDWEWLAILGALALGLAGNYYRRKQKPMSKNRSILWIIIGVAAGLVILLAVTFIVMLSTANRV